MGSSDFYNHYQRYGRNVSMNHTFIATDSGTVTLITPVADNAAQHTIFVQKISVYIKTSVAESATIVDSDGSAPREVAKVPASPGAASKFTWDFGPKGYALTQGKNLTLVFSGAGLAGHLEVEAYTTQSATFGL